MADVKILHPKISLKTQKKITTQLSARAFYFKL